MSFDISGLSAYVQQHGKDFAKKAVAGAKTAKLLMDERAVVIGKPGNHQIPILDVDANIQDGSVTGRNASGSVTLTEKSIKIARWKDQQNLNMDDLYGAYTVELLAKGQEPEGETLDTEVLNAIIERRAAKIANKFEQILWKGDTAGGSAPMNLIDGILKQLASGTFSVTISASSIMGKLQEAYEQMPAEITSDPAFRIFMSEATHKKYQAELFNANYFQAVDSKTLAGFDAKIEVVPGLNGQTSGSVKAVLGKITDLRFGTDNEGDINNCKMTWSVETEQWYLDFNFAGGVKVVFPDQFAVVTVG